MHAMPNLKVLDQHVITQAERMKAKARIGGDIQALTVAFGKRAPVRDPAWDEKTSERSVLEQELVKVRNGTGGVGLEGQQTDHVGGDMWQGCIPEAVS